MNSLLKHFSQRPNSNLRIIASIDPAAVEAELDEWKINGQRPKIGIRAQANLAFVVVRVIVGVIRRAVEEENIQHSKELRERELDKLQAETELIKA